MANEKRRKKRFIVKNLTLLDRRRGSSAFFIFKKQRIFQLLVRAGNAAHIWTGALLTNIIITPALLAVICGRNMVPGQRSVVFVKSR